METRERLWNANYWRVMAANMLLHFAFYLLVPLLPLYLKETFGADKDTIGLVLSGYTIAALLVRPFSGYIVDAFPRKRVLMVVYAIFFLFFAGYLGALTILTFAIVRTLHGLPFGATTVACSTIASDVVPSSRRNEAMGYYDLSNNIAMALAPSVALAVYTRTADFRILFWMALIAAGAGFYAVTQIRTRQRTLISRRPRMSLDHFFLLRAWPLALNMMFFAICWGIMSNYVALYGKEILHITGGTGAFFALVATGLICSRLYGARMLRQGRLTHAAMEGAAISTIGYALFALCPHLVAYYTSALLIGLGNGRMWPAFLNMFLHIARHDERGTANSSLLTAWDLGIGIGVLLGGLLLQHAGYTPAFILTALSQTLGALLFYLVGRRTYRRLALD